MATIRTSDSQGIYDLKYPGAAIDAILDTAYDLQNAGYIFRGLASEYSTTPTERSWVLAGEGETGHGFTSPIPKGYIGVCVFNGTSWTGKLLKCVSIDSAPTNGSTNALSSGGAYASITNLATFINEALDNLTFTDTTPSAFLGNYIKMKVSTTNGSLERILTYFTILAATTSKAGLLSAADKAKLDAILTNLRSLEIDDTTAYADLGDKIVESIKATIGGTEETISTFQLLAATASKAGLLSAADKAKLDAILTNLRSLEIDDTTAYADLGDKIVESIKATIGGTEETISTFQLLAATASKAGLLSAADKAKLDALWSSGYQFAGIATPSTTPISTTSKIFYIATEAGTYFNAVTVTQGINLLSWNGTSWSAVQVIGIDDEPTAGSSNLVESGSTYTFGGVGNAVLALGDSGALTDIRARFTTWNDGYVYVGVEGGGGRTRGGVYTTSTLYVYSNFVDVSDLVGKYILITLPVNSSDIVGVALYNSEQECVGVYKKNIESYNVFAIRGFLIPSNVKYIRTTFYKMSLSNFACKYSDNNGVVGITDNLEKFTNNSHASYLKNSRCYRIKSSMQKGNVSAETGEIVSTSSSFYVLDIPTQITDNIVYVKGANKYVSNYGMAGYINGVFYAGHKLYGDEIIDISDWINNSVDEIKISSSTNCTVAIGTDDIAHSLLNTRSVATVPVDFASGNRNVSSEDGSFVATTYNTHYANEIDLEDVTLIEIDHLLSYRGKYGYAYLDNNDNVIYSKRLSGQTTITTNKLLSLRSQGATKFRISVSNASVIKVTKMTAGSAIDDIYTKLSTNKTNRYDSFYNYIGIKKAYLPTSLPDADNFDSLTAIYDAYDSLHTQYPVFMSESDVIGVDESGEYDIKAYSLGFQYPLITNDRGGTGDNLFDNYNINKRHILVCSGVHPTEKNSIEGTYLAIKGILESEEDWAMFIKNNFIIDIVPVINPWGVVNNSSKNVNDVNLNRDYDEQTQAETQAMCAFIDGLKGKGLIGIIDLHNTTTGNGYLVTKDWYRYFDYYVVLTQQISSEMYDVLKEVYGTTKQNNFHTWLASETGQLHEYANSINVLGVTVEFNANIKSPTLTKTACINIINQFATFDGTIKDDNPD